MVQCTFLCFHGVTFPAYIFRFLIFLLLGLVIRLQQVCHTNATLEFDVTSQVFDSQEKYAQGCRGLDKEIYLRNEGQNLETSLLRCHQDINLIYLLSWILLFPWGMLPFLNDSLDFGFRSYRLSLLIRSCKFKQNFIREKQLHIYFIVQLYLYIQKNRVIISEKYRHHLQIYCRKVCRPARPPYIIMF